MADPFAPAERWFAWDASAQCKFNVENWRNARPSEPISRESFQEAWMAAFKDIGVIDADRMWRSYLPECHEHYWRWMLSGEIKFEGVDMHEETPAPTIGPRMANADGTFGFGAQLGPKPQKRPMTDDEKFNYRIRKMFEQEKARYVS